MVINTISVVPDAARPLTLNRGCDNAAATRPAVSPVQRGNSRNDRIR